jgi:phosphoribosylanthranilate isomerase
MKRSSGPASRPLQMIVKICGITNLADARHALRCGADWIGLNLVGGPRRLALTQADEILTGLNDPDKVVVLVSLVDGRVPSVTAARLRNRGVRRIQLYGDFTAAGLQGLAHDGYRLILVRPVKGTESITELATTLAKCGEGTIEHLLFDASREGQMGGTGQQADWNAIVDAWQRGLHKRWPPTLLAGGLNAENVSEAIRIVSPAGVDVSSGVESEPGRKDPAKVAAFIEKARAARAG